MFTHVVSLYIDLSVDYSSVYPCICAYIVDTDAYVTLDLDDANDDASYDGDTASTAGRTVVVFTLFF